MNVYHEGSAVSAAATHFDLATGDLTRYRELLVQLREADLELEETLESFPVGAPEKEDQRYCKAKIDRDIDDERHHVARLAAILTSFGEQQEQMDSLAGEDFEDFQQPVDEGGGQLHQEGAGGLEGSEMLAPALTVTASARMAETTARDLIAATAGLILEGRTIDGGSGADSLEALGDMTAQGLVSPTLPGWEAPQADGDRERQTRQETPLLRQDQTNPLHHIQVPGVESLQPPHAPIGPGRLQGSNLQDQRVFSRPSPVLSIWTPPPLRSGPQLRVPQPAGPGFGVGSRAPHTYRSRGLSSRPRSQATHQPTQTLGVSRRRSQSEERTSGRTTRGQEALPEERLEDRLFRLSFLVQGRCSDVEVALQGLQETLTTQAEHEPFPLDWLDGELFRVKEAIDSAQVQETEIWLLTDRILGTRACQDRALQWTSWNRKMAETCSNIKKRAWKFRKSQPPSKPMEVPPYRRSGGFVEKVRLPVFTGSIEDYAEFKGQFRQLCSGEGYTEIIELAQMRQKLPKEAVDLIAGLSSTSKAWLRLDEKYGNVEMSVITALKRLRNFKTSKSAAHDQIQELCSAIQRCMTVLESLGKERAFLRDRETLADVLYCLPHDATQ